MVTLAPGPTAKSQAGSPVRHFRTRESTRACPFLPRRARNTDSKSARFDRVLGRRQWLLGVAGGALVSPFAASAQVRPPARLDLGGLPTPVSAHPRLARRLGLGSLHVKRDDRAGAIFGGSKARKLERLLAAARSEGAHAVLTFGGAGSNHALATAVHARRVGLQAHLILLPEPPGAHVRSHLLAALNAGARLHAGTRADRDDPALAITRFARGEAPYVIPPGGTCAIGDLGYVDAAFELAEQIAAGDLPAPDVLYVAAGTTGTAAGLWVGLNAAGLRTRVVAVRASGRITANRSRVTAEVSATAALLRGFRSGFVATPLDARFEIEDGFVGEGYARRTDAGRRASERVGGELELDPTYTEKAFAALIARAPSHAGESVLFWHTFDPRRPPIGGARVRDLPRGLRGYARE